MTNAESQRISQGWRNALVALGILIVIVVAFLAWFDWNMLKGYVERKVTEATGREFLIKGNLDVRLSLNPLITANGLTLANAEWGTKQPMLDVDSVAFRISLLQLLKRNIVLPEVSVSHPKVNLERNANGERNWILKKHDDQQSPPPHIGRLTVDEGTLNFLDPKAQTDITILVATEAAKDARESAINFKATGSLKSLKFTAEGTGGAVLTLADPTTAYPLKGRAQIGTTHVAVDGTITGVATLAALDLKLDLRGDDLSALYPILGIVLFPSPPYQIAGRLLHDDNDWSMKGFTGRVGDSDLSGDVLFSNAGKRPMLKGDLVSKVVDLRDLAGFIGPRRGPKPEDPAPVKEAKAASIAAQSGRLLPSQEFQLDRLGAMDADVKFTGKSVRNKDLPVDNVVTHLQLENSLLRLNPLNFGVAGGEIVSNISLNAREKVPALDAKIDFKRLQLPKLFPKVDLTKTSLGSIGGTADIKGRGNSFGGLLGSADGRFALLMSEGQISNLLLEFLGLDGGEIMRFLFGGDRVVDVRCAVADFAIKDGVMESQAFVFDTSDTQVLGVGAISLVDEKLNLTLKPLPKDRSILSLRSPIHIRGTFKDPQVRPDKTLALRGGAALLLGVLINPLAALIPLIETGPGKDSNCAAIFAAAKQPDKNSKR
jgi:hypothetical protein